MKLLSLFGKKLKKSTAATRNLNSYVGFITSVPASRTPGRLSRASVHPAPSTTSPLHRIENKCPKVDEMFETEHRQLIEAFRIIDRNGDGKISKQELGAMWASLGEKVTDEELRLMIEEVDLNGDGEIDLGEFVTLNSKFGLGFDDRAEHAEDLRVAFNVADADRDGYISAADLQLVMGRLGQEKVTIAESSAMLKCVDTDGDSLINFEEFERLMSSNLLASYH